MSLPAVEALSKKFELHIIGPKWTRELYRPFCCHFHAPGESTACETILLLKPSTASAWRARKYRRRIGLGGGFRRFLLSDTVQSSEHRIDGFNALARKLGVEACKTPCWSVEEEAPEVPTDSALFIIGSNSAGTVRWKHFQQLARTIPMTPVFRGGPGDELAVQRLGKGQTRLPTDLTLAQVATIARKSKVVIGLDSGLSHLAVAARNAQGIDPSTNLILYGSTDPSRTGPRGSMAIFNRRPPCWPCYQKRCHKGTPCLDTGTEEVLEALP